MRELPTPNRLFGSEFQETFDGSFPAQEKQSYSQQRHIYDHSEDQNNFLQPSITMEDHHSKLDGTERHCIRQQEGYGHDYQTFSQFPNQMSQSLPPYHLDHPYFNVAKRGARQQQPLTPSRHRHKETDFLNLPSDSSIGNYGLDADGDGEINDYHLPQSALAQLDEPVDNFLDLADDPNPYPQSDNHNLQSHIDHWHQQSETEDHSRFEGLHSNHYHTQQLTNPMINHLDNQLMSKMSDITEPSFREETSFQRFQKRKPPSDGIPKFSETHRKRLKLVTEESRGQPPSGQRDDGIPFMESMNPSPCKLFQVGNEHEEELPTSPGGLRFFDNGCQVDMYGHPLESSPPVDSGHYGGEMGYNNNEFMWHPPGNLQDHDPTIDDVFY